jgi:hypothetical protein
MFGLILTGSVVEEGQRLRKNLIILLDISVHENILMAKMLVTREMQYVLLLGLVFCFYGIILLQHLVSCHIFSFPYIYINDYQRICFYPWILVVMKKGKLGIC